MSTTISNPAGEQGAGKPAAMPGVWPYYVLFFLSGFPALLYQIVWQRTLFTLFGVNIESVTIVVTVFMLGLGLGSLAGGALSARAGTRLLVAFGVIELSIGAFGAASLWIFHVVASLTAGISLMTTGVAAFGLLLVPTLLMGSTLPLLSEHFVRRTGNVGESVGLLYGVNTLGSAAACLAAAYFVMRWLGESGTVRLAVCFNLFVGISALVLQRGPAAVEKAHATRAERQQTIPLWLGLVLAGVTGFIALAYEIVWYRTYSWAAGGTAMCFAKLLGCYLLGIAGAAGTVRWACRRKLGNDVERTMAVGSEVVLIGAIAAFLVGPALAVWMTFIYSISPLPVLISAALLGAAFPLLSHAAIDPASQVGKGVSLLYLSNIIGSALGSFLIGFIVLDHWSTRATSLLLLGLGLAVSLVFAWHSGAKLRKAFFAVECAICLMLALGSHALFSGMYERLLVKTDYRSGMRFSEIVENRSGVIAVSKNTKDMGYARDTVYGGGVYDGQFNIDMMRDSNMLYRAFAVAGMGPVPRRVLMIGIGSGSWSQVIASDPEVQDCTIVEINPGYLQLIRSHAEVASLLSNPKVHIVIDDGRRWLVGHPGRRFDFIVMNTTFNWRANATNLLSKEFLELARAHLNPGGVLYYNTTWSQRVMATGVVVFPYALRVTNFLAVSDSPFRLDRERWRAMLSNYRIDGHPVFDLSRPEQRARLEQVLKLADELDVPGGELESRASLANRLRGVRLVTEDNMGTEWAREKP
jgi:predicted membrane-bound spermidine synthase